MSPHPLDNVFWQCLSGPHRDWTVGSERARRYRKGYSQIAAFADPGNADLNALAAITQVGESFYVQGWSGPLQGKEWSIAFEAPMVAMAWTGAVKPSPSHRTLVRLTAEHWPEVKALVELTRPGPFGPHTLSMGEFVGLFDDQGQLMAMAGERTRAGLWHEVSGICTHPEHQGKGLGRTLTHEVVRRQLDRGEHPYLHALADNHTAVGMYRKLGFETVLTTPVRVVQRL